MTATGFVTGVATRDAEDQVVSFHDAAVRTMLREAETLCNCGESHSRGRRWCRCYASSVYRPTTRS
ncbi:MAG: hypothetical protein WCA46_01435 [Actinocatenispora sp.]